MAQLESDLLRTFLAVAEAGSVTEGAARVFRSQSAASLQLKRLEATVAQPLFERHGRGVTLTDAGRRLLPVAREVTERLDGALRDLAPGGLRGRLRLGIPDDQGRTRLARIIATVARSHPLLELEVTCALSKSFSDDLARGRLDIAVYEVETPGPGEERLTREPTVWVSARHRNIVNIDPLPVALFDPACWWRDVALASLRQRDRPFRIVFSSHSVAGVLAAVETGVGVGLLGRTAIGDDLAILGEDQGFGPTPDSILVLATARTEETPAIQAMKAAIRAAFHD
ncbi:LysR substrate-binding domain-containing protein [Amorphus coralli]|uniref:LysR substrate-binding domain-containing protein n=1 Tax=Amorphus coralli TaxID=340680 RepID=UPI00035D1C15|nr:LysR substrate-binding domain-containing protein [Amorphus coralli]